MENSMLVDLIRSVAAEICAYIIIELLKKHQIKLSDLEKYDNTDIEEVNENLFPRLPAQMRLQSKLMQHIPM